MERASRLRPRRSHAILVDWVYTVVPDALAERVRDNVFDRGGGDAEACGGSRSIVMYSESPLGPRVPARHSTIRGSFCRRSRRRVIQTSKAPGLALSQHDWYLLSLRLTVEIEVRSCAGPAIRA